MKGDGGGKRWKEEGIVRFFGIIRLKWFCEKFVFVESGVDGDSDAYKCGMFKEPRSKISFKTLYL